MTNRARELTRAGDKQNALEVWLGLEQQWPDAEKAVAKPVAALMLDLGHPESALERIDRMAVPDATMLKLRLRALYQLDRREELIRTITTNQNINEVTFASLAVKMLRDIGEYEPARSLLNQARMRWPQEVRLVLLALSDAAIKNDSVAILELFNTLPEELKEHGDLVAHRARALFRVGNLDEAEELCRVKLKQIPDNQQLLLLLARIVQKILNCAQQSGETVIDAHECWHAVLSLSPDHKEALGALARNALDFGTRDEAVFALDRLSALPDATQSQKTTRLLTRFAERFDEDTSVALTWRSQLHSGQGKLDDIQCIALALAQLEQRSGEWTGTLTALDHAGDLANVEEAKLLGAQALYELGRYEDAASRIGDISMWDKQRPQALDLKLESLIKANLLEDAKVLIDAQAAHSSTRVQIKLGRAEFLQQRYEAALSLFRKAVVREPEDKIEAKVWVVRTIEKIEGPHQAAIAVRL